MSELLDIGAVVAQYVKVRDKVTQIKTEHKEQLAPYDKAMEAIEQTLLEYFNTTKQESAKTSAGTAYRAKQTSATVADRNAFLEWMKANDRWDCADVRAAKTAITEHVETEEEPPPGINYSTRYTVNIRRS